MAKIGDDGDVLPTINLKHLGGMFQASYRYYKKHVALKTYYHKETPTGGMYLLLETKDTILKGNHPFLAFWTIGTKHKLVPYLYAN